MSHMNRIIKARTSLLLRHPFWGILAMRLAVQIDESVGTACTNGEYMKFSPKYIDKLTDKQLIGLVAHEVGHCVWDHMGRLNGRDHHAFNVACDYALDPVLIKNGLEVPDALVNQDWIGFSPEKIYELLPRKGGSGNAGQSNSGNGGEQPQAGGGEQPQAGGGGKTKGEFVQAPSTATSSEWKVAVSNAAQMAKAQGKLPADLEGLILSILEPKVNWKDELRRFVQTNMRNDYAWQQPNRRYIASGLYLPVMQSDSMPPIIIGADSSGSMWEPATLSAIKAEINSIISECKPETTHVVHCDAKVQKVDEIDGDSDFDFQPKGGGGTDFRPVFDWADKEGIEPACLIYLTDCMGSYPDEAPSYPVLWACNVKEKDLGRYKPPFGEFLYIGE